MKGRGIFQSGIHLEPLKEIWADQDDRRLLFGILHFLDDLYLIVIGEQQPFEVDVVYQVEIARALELGKRGVVGNEFWASQDRSEIGGERRIG